MRIPSILAAAVVCFLSVGLPATGCSAACALSCGSGVIVWWVPGEVPNAPLYNLCVNDVCESVVTHPIGSEGQFMHVSPRAATGETDVSVRLELLDGSGTPVEVISGSGTKTGECCAGVEFRVQNGQMSVERL